MYVSGWSQHSVYIKHTLWLRFNITGDTAFPPDHIESWHMEHLQPHTMSLLGGLNETQAQCNVQNEKQSFLLFPLLCWTLPLCGSFSLFMRRIEGGGGSKVIKQHGVNLWRRETGTLTWALQRLSRRLLPLLQGWLGIEWSHISWLWTEKKSK